MVSQRATLPEIKLDFNPELARKRPAFSQSKLPARNRAVVDSDGVWLHTEYEGGFIEVLKEFFPWYTRRWHPEKTAWRVDGPGNIAEALSIFRMFFPEGEVIDD